MTCPQYREAVSWLAARWAEDAEGVPTRTHAHADDVEPDSQLGSPREMPALTRWIDSPFASTRLSDDAFSDRLYLRPLATALRKVRENPGSYWPRETVGPVDLLLVLRSCNFDYTLAADRLGIFPDQAHDWAILAFRMVRRKYRPTVPARDLPPRDKSESQLTAESAA